MRIVNLKFSFTHVPPVMRRGRHALILLKDSQGKYVLGHKSAYPEGIVRMVGGGIDPEEDPQLGAARELAEELGVQVDPEQLTPLAEVVAQVEGPENEYLFVTFVYFYQLTAEVLQPSDDIEDVRHLTAQDYDQLIERFRNLPDTLINGKQSGEEHMFRWSDYGALYAEIHAVAREELERAKR